MSVRACVHATCVCVCVCSLAPQVSVVAALSQRGTKKPTFKALLDMFRRARARSLMPQSSKA